jgi:hypothetical protein
MSCTNMVPEPGGQNSPNTAHSPPLRHADVNNTHQMAVEMHPSASSLVVARRSQEEIRHYHPKDKANSAVTAKLQDRSKPVDCSAFRSR